PRNRKATTGNQLLPQKPGRVEERQFDRGLVRLIPDRDHQPPRRRFHGRDARHEKGVVAFLKCGDRRDARAVDVAARYVVNQIAQRMDARGRESLLSLGAKTRETKKFRHPSKGANENAKISRMNRDTAQEESRGDGRTYCARLASSDVTYSSQHPFLWYSKTIFNCFIPSIFRVKQG